MGNLLTHGLLAGAMMAIANVLTGTEPMSWTVFPAAMVAIALDLDSGDERIAPGSPLCHSLGCGIIMVYLAGAGAYLAWAFLGMDSTLLLGMVLAIGAGILAHLAAEVATGIQVFTFPGNLKPDTWLVRCDCDSARFWPAWGRFTLARWRVRDSHLNALSLSVILATIGLFQTF